MALDKEIMAERRDSNLVPLGTHASKRVLSHSDTSRARIVQPVGSVLISAGASGLFLSHSPKFS